MTINDEVFGKMDFDYGWAKEEVISLYSHEYKIVCVASAYTGQQIEKIQQDKYVEYKKTEYALIEKAEVALIEYCKSNGINITDGIEKHIKPTEIVFQQNGEVGILLNCDWDNESGIAIYLLPQIKIDIQDAFL